MDRSTHCPGMATEVFLMTVIKYMLKLSLCIFLKAMSCKVGTFLCQHNNDDTLITALTWNSALIEISGNFSRSHLYFTFCYRNNFLYQQWKFEANKENVSAKKQKTPLRSRQSFH